MGASLLDADNVAHEAIARGKPAYHKIVERFGKDVLDDKGNVDRRVLGSIVFEDRAALEDLNAIVHPEVYRFFAHWADTETKSGRNAVGMIPLLFENGREDEWDAIICVEAEKETVIDRLKRKGLEREEALRRIAAQMPVSEKAAKADYVIENNDARSCLEDRVRETWKRILKEVKPKP